MSWGLGGAALVLGGAMMTLGGGEMLGSGLQGLGVGLFNLGIGLTITTTFWMGGTSLINMANAGSNLLISKIGKSSPEIKIGSNLPPSSGQPFSDEIKREALEENPTQTCVYCGRPGSATQVDHAVPKSIGGDATINIAQLTCPHCNQSKGNRLFH